MKRGDNRTKSVTMADIANALGVSNVTVSNALAGKKGVSDQLRSMVEMKARELGYLKENEPEAIEQPAPVASQAGDVGIIVPRRFLSNENGLHWQIYQELITQLKAYNSYAILDVISEEDESALRLPRIIENHLVSGLIMLGRPNVKFLNEVSKRGLPIVFLDFSMRNFNFASVAGDDYYDMSRLASFIISHGHTNICYVAESLEELQRDRYFGYCRAMAEIEIKPSAPHLLDQAVESYETQRPTAFICESRQLAEKLIKSLGEISVTVPEMASVGCFSDVKADDGAEITCVCRDPSQMARLAVEAMRGALSGNGKGNGRIAVGGRLIAGSTIRSIII